MSPNKLGGLAFVVGVVATLAGNLSHPRAETGVLGAESIDAEAKLITSNIGIWYPSHTLIAFSIPFLLLGYLSVYRSAKETGGRVFALPAILSVGIWAVLATISIIIDGYVTPLLAQDYVAASEGAKQLQAAILNYDLILSLSFLGAAFLALSVGITLFGGTLLKGKLYNRWLASAGVVIGLIGLLGYIAGLFGPYWVLSPLFTPFILTLVIWVLLLGVSHYRGR